MHDDHDERNEEDQVNESTGEVQSQAENPAEDEDDSDNGEHDKLKLKTFIPYSSLPRPMVLSPVPTEFCFRQ